MLVMIDDKEVDPNEAVISVFDLGFSRGLSVFELLRTYQEEPCFLEEHIERLILSARAMGLDLNVSKFDLLERVEMLLAKRKGIDSMIKIIATARKSTHRMLPMGFAKIFVIVSDIDSIDQEMYTNGIALKSTKIQRMHPNIKSTNYAPAVKEIKSAMNEDFHDILYTHPDGLVCESSTSNIFFIRNETLFTPQNHVLRGITREAILEHVPHNYACKECDIYIDEIGEFDEAFLTSSIKEILPIRQIDDVEFQSCGKNSLSLELLEMYRALFNPSCV